MPKFELVSLADAEVNSASGKRAEILREYLGYINQLQGDQAGRLQVTEGESPAAVRRRLGAAARLAGKDIVIRRLGDEVYFWARSGTRRGGRHGRPRKG